MSTHENNPWRHPCWIITEPRTGSTWLSQLLNRAAGLSAIDNSSPIHFGEHHHTNSVYDHSITPPFVTKCHIHWLASGRVAPPPLTTRVILLTRHNRHAQALSLLSSSASGIFNSSCPDEIRKHQQRAAESTFTVGQFNEHLSVIEEWESRAAAFANLYQSLHINYEMICDDPAGTIGRIIDTLELLDSYEYRPSDLLCMSGKVQ